MNVGERALEVLLCAGCGSSVALTDEHTASCAHCKREVPVPEAHRERHRELESARLDRVRAEGVLRKLPRPLPAWLVTTGAWVVSLAVPTWIVLAILGWVFWGWFPSPLHMLGWGIFTPILLGMFLLIDLMGARGYSRGLAALSAVHDEGGWACRRCGAPLALEIDTLAATCDYCESDNLLSDPGPRFRRALDRERKAASRSLSEAVRTMKKQRKDRMLLRVVLAAVLVPIWLLFVGPLIAQYFFD